MSIDIKHLADAEATDVTRMTAKNIFELLKDNKDKAYSILDMQNHFKLQYQKISSAIRTLKRIYDKNIQYKWVRFSGFNRMLYYAYKESEPNKKEKTPKKPSCD